MAAKAAAAANKRSKPSKAPKAAKVTAKRAVPAATATKRATKSAGSPKVTSAPRNARTVNGNVVTPVAWGMAQRTEDLANALGGVTALARALGVSPSQPSRWKSGKEAPGPEMARRLLDLDHVVARARMVWHPSVIPNWLVSSNGHLNGQTPLGVLTTRGPNEVLDALDATEQGAFA